MSEPAGPSGTAGPLGAVRGAWRRVAPAMPGVTAFRGYRRGWLRGDLLAGVTVTAYLVPQVMAYASVAGLPPVAGLWAIVPALALYAVLGSSRLLSVGPESTTALMTATVVGPLAAGNAGRYADLAAALAVLVGLFCLLAWLARLGFVADLFSRPVLIGYMAGVALILLVDQLSKLTGVRVAGDGFGPQLRSFARNLAGAQAGTMVLSAAALFALLLMARLLPKVPGPLVVAAVATAVVAGFGLSRHGIAVVGQIPTGIPRPRLPDFGDTSRLLLPAASVLLVGYADVILTARAFESGDCAGKPGSVRGSDHGESADRRRLAAHPNHPSATRYEDAPGARPRSSPSRSADHDPNPEPTLDANRELLALGAANLGAGLLRGFPVSSSASRTALARSAGGRSQMYALVADSAVVAVLLFLGPLIRFTPKAVLGALVVFAAVQLIDIAGFRRLMRFRRREFILAVGCLLGVLALGVLYGVLVAVGLSVAELLSRVARPHDAVQGLVPGVAGMHDIEDYPQAQTIPGLVVYRYDSPLFFANAQDFRRRALAAVSAEKDPVRWFVLNTEANVEVDITALDAVEALRGELTGRGIIFALARVKQDLRTELDAYGLSASIGEDRIYPTLPMAVAAYEAWSREQESSTDS